MSLAFAAGDEIERKLSMRGDCIGDNEGINARDKERLGVGSSRITFTFTQLDVQKLICAHLRERGMRVTESDVKFTVYPGYPGSRDPREPQSPYFGHASVEVKQEI